MVVTILLILLCIHSTLAVNVKVGLFIPSAMADVLQDPKILDVMLTIMLNYDLIALHGNIDEQGLKLLLEKLQEKDSTYRKVITRNVMRPGKNFPESVGFIYRGRVVDVSKMAVDSSLSIFYTQVKVASNSSSYKFIYADVDSAASKRFQVLTGLPSAYDRIATVTSLKDVLFAGNFWTGEPYISKDQYKFLAVTEDKRFTWYIDYKDNDVAIAYFNDAFVRLLGAGGIRDHVVPNSTNIYNFDKHFNLTITERNGPLLTIFGAPFAETIMGIPGSIKFFTRN